MVAGDSDLPIGFCGEDESETRGKGKTLVAVNGGTEAGGSSTTSVSQPWPVGRGKLLNSPAQLARADSGG